MTQIVTKDNPLGTEKIGKLMVRFAVPSIISLVVNSLYNMVDQIFIGQKVGYLGNAATNVILPLTTFMMALSVMIGDGVAAFMSLNLGKGKPDKAAHGVGNAITLTVISGILITILFEIFLNPLCHIFGATENSLPYALKYGRIIELGFVFFAIDAAFASIIRADGKPNSGMIGLLIGCITNIILDPIFIFVFEWGVAGAALVLVMATMNNVLVKYGAVSKYGPDIPLAALGITMKVSQLITNIAVGLAAGIQPIYGYNYGSMKFDRVKKLYKCALFDTTVILLVALIVFQVFPKPIINFFGQESDLYMEYAIKCFRIYLLGCFMIGANAVTGIFFQSIGKPVQSAFLSLSRQIVFLVPGLLILGATVGVEGLLWAGPIADISAGVISLITVLICWKKIFMEEKNSY